MKLSLYRMATSLGGPLIRLYLNKRLKRGKEDPMRFAERLGIADDVVNNDGALSQLVKQVDELHLSYTQASID